MQYNEKTAWHLLQASDVLDYELASALSESSRVVVWEPRRTVFPWGRRASAAQPVSQGSTLRHMRFPLLRGYARRPLTSIARIGASITAMLREVTPDERHSPLICTVPYFAAVAEQWSGPVIYWLTDLIAAYANTHGVDIRALDERMCRRATLVCPNSERLRTYLMEQAHCDPEKIRVIPNATRALNVLKDPPTTVGALPFQLSNVPRPVAGVIGNLAGNMDWLLLEKMIEAVDGVSWAFVGPTSMRINDPVQARARTRVMKHPRSHFVGRQPYGDLALFARSFDVAVLPYLRCEPTYSGSSTRFYEHLCACRPMIATEGLEELTRKEPLLRLVKGPEDAVAALLKLQAMGFDDGLTSERWQASRDATWEVRAASIQQALSERQHVIESFFDHPVEEAARSVTESPC